MPLPFAKQGGLTLIELMIGMALGLLVLSGIGYIYLGSRQSYKLQDNMARIQENGRYAMEILGREIRMAGFQGCSTAKFKSTINAQAGAQNNYIYDFSRNAVEGFNATGVGTWSTVTSGNPATAVGVSNIDTLVVSGTDVIALRSTDSLGIRITGQPTDNNCGDTTADLKVTSNTLLSDGLVVMATNCTHATVFQITNFNSGQNVVHNTGTASPGNATKDLGACFVDGDIVAVSAKSYYIRNNLAGIPALFRKASLSATSSAEELVDGIEDMQIKYGIDTNADGAVDEYVDADEPNKLDTAARWATVLSVRINLLLVSRENGVLDAPQRYVFNGSTVDPPSTDRRLRFVYTATIGVRNRLL
ncbi:MAG: PilW family protein [Betaproteobacteria bacterium]|nr:PilW family protein [Betaproteobacteria bacterium]